MAKPWAVYNAQGKLIKRYETEARAIADNLSKIAVDIQYRPRAKNAKRVYPYVGDNKL